jgi:molybdopterin converting factor small subunit
MLMPKVKFTSALKRFFPSLSETKLEASTVRTVLAKLEENYPGISSYIVDDAGQLRQHVNIFLRGELIKDRIHLSDEVKPNDEVLIFQALSGG